MCGVSDYVVYLEQNHITLSHVKKKKSIKRLGPTLTPNKKITLVGIKKKIIYLMKSNLSCIIHMAYAIIIF